MLTYADVCAAESARAPTFELLYGHVEEAGDDGGDARVGVLEEECCVSICTFVRVKQVN
jgi:hypothetical protein